MTAGTDDEPTPGKTRRRRNAALAPEELSLWQRVAETITPLAQAKPRVPDVEVPAGARAARPPDSGGGKSTARRAEPASAGTSRAADAATHREPPAGSAAANRRAPQHLPTLDRRQVRRIASGVVEIDARVDLHGLTQAEAHRRLASFINDAAAAGLKTVLVITGKGGRWRGSGADFDRGGESEVGVLRRSVPRWLEEGSLRGLIVSTRSASPKHGGDGALYVVLRRRRR